MTESRHPCRPPDRTLLESLYVEHPALVVDDKLHGEEQHGVIDQVLGLEPNSSLPIAMDVYSVIDHAQSPGAFIPQHSVIDHAELEIERSSSRLGHINEDTTQSIVVGSRLDAGAVEFVSRDLDLVLGGKNVPDLDEDWDLVQQVHARNIPLLGTRQSPSIETGPQACEKLPYGELNPAEPALKVSRLAEYVVQTPFGPFHDRVLPPTAHRVVSQEFYTPDYFVSLHNVVAAPGIREDGSCYPAFTPNYLGARVKLAHVRLRIDRWRYHLVGYEHVDIIQLLEHGFPLGLQELPDLASSHRNHGSAYNFFPHVDKFVADEVVKGGVTGPLNKSPWWNTIVSPVMTAPKKPSSRRTVFDASFGDKSVNNSTPSDCYLGQPCVYTYPKIDDFRRMVLRCGIGCYMWKRDLSRFFLQIPMDPAEYHRVCFIWRGLFFFFVGLAFGLRHSGLQGQKMTDCVSWIHRRKGLETDAEEMFYTVNYCDDFGGVEDDEARAIESFDHMKWLLDDLGLQEATKKSEAPSKQMTFLGVLFDSSNMTMRVPPDKLAEVKDEIGKWVKKTTITKQNLQSLLGKLFWVARVIRFARVFMGRLLAQLRTMSGEAERYKVKLTNESRKDLLWWQRYLDHFNGIQMIIDEDPFTLELDQMLDRPFELCAGDATPTGCGAWHGTQYWCRNFPISLQDPAIPIHLKEFWWIIVSARLWGNYWSGRSVTIFCDNDSVVDTINYRKPKDAMMLSLLREFLYVVVTMKFFPVTRKIGTKQNYLADHISRRYDANAADVIFSKAGLPNMQLIQVPDLSFKLTEPW